MTQKRESDSSYFLLILSNAAMIVYRLSMLVWLLFLLYCSHVEVSVLCHVLAVPWIGLWSVIVAFPSHTHLLSG